MSDPVPLRDSLNNPRLITFVVVNTSVFIDSQAFRLQVKAKQNGVSPPSPQPLSLKAKAVQFCGVLSMASIPLPCADTPRGQVLLFNEEKWAIIGYDYDLDV